MDPAFLKLIRKLDKATYNQLSEFEKELIDAYREHQRGEDLVDVEKLYEKITKIAARFQLAFAATLLAYNILASKTANAQDYKLMQEAFKEAGATKPAFRFLEQQMTNADRKLAETFLKRNFPGTKTSVEQRIINITAGAEKTVRNIIQLGIKEGASSYDIAKEISQYVLPNKRGLRVSPWSIARRALGKPTSYIPKGIPAGSVEYNAMRIARAETAATYQQAPYLAHKDKWYVEGFKWNLSGAHPKEDICDDYAKHKEGIGIGIWRKVPKLPHPHCLCFVTTVLIDADELIEWLKKLDWR